MGRMFCSECGTQLDDSAKFCSNCGFEIESINSNNDKEISNRSTDATTDMMKRIELPLLVCAIIVVWFFGSLYSFAFYTTGQYHTTNFIASLGIVILAFLVGYLSNESIIFVMGYAIAMDLIIYLTAHRNAWWAFLPIIIFAFIGKFVKIKLKSR